jgi:hypothetical protein
MTTHTTQHEQAQPVERLADNILASLAAMDRSGGIEQREEYNRAAIIDYLRFSRGLTAQAEP